MVELAFFGHDARDPAVQRRIKAFAQAGARVQGFTMRRGAPVDADWDNVDLGETQDAAFAQRIWALGKASPILDRHRDALKRADIFYARNLDMLALAYLGKRRSGSRALLVYECLDVHRFMTRGDALGAGMRAIERTLMKDTALVVVSSPAFAREYFAKQHPRAKTLLIENRMPWGFDYGPRPTGPQSGSGRLRIGWFGNLRCKRSLTLLTGLAARFPDRVSLSLRGAPARTELGAFEEQLAQLPNVSFGGRYAWPADLAGIYSDVDLVWAGDFHDAGANSRWLLPNRLYEGGYYAVPPIAPADSETGRWIEAHGAGFTLPEPLEETLPAFIAGLNAAAIEAARARLLAAPDAQFLQPRDELKQILALAEAPQTEQARVGA